VTDVDEVSERQSVPPQEPRRTRRRRRRRVRGLLRRVPWKRLVGFGALLLFAYYVVSLVQVARAGRVNDPDAADVIVVLGAAQYDGTPSPQLAARLDHAVDLWERDIAPAVMVTGGNQPGDRFTEAEASMDYLIERGIPETAILSEDEGGTTYESLRAAAEQLVAADQREVVLVTDPYHALRSKLTAEEVGLDPQVSPTPYTVVDGWTAFRRDLFEAGGVAVGRIIGFGRLSGLTG
jgi:uncharacterized SAM-binding protein YcdF (DUF218 family)